MAQRKLPWWGVLLGSLIVGTGAGTIVFDILRPEETLKLPYSPQPALNRVVICADVRHPRRVRKAVKTWEEMCYPRSIVEERVCYGKPDRGTVYVKGCDQPGDPCVAPDGTREGRTVPTVDGGWYVFLNDFRHDCVDDHEFGHVHRGGGHAPVDGHLMSAKCGRSREALDRCQE